MNNYNNGKICIAKNQPTTLKIKAMKKIVSITFALALIASSYAQHKLHSRF